MPAHSLALSSDLWEMKGCIWCCKTMRVCPNLGSQQQRWVDFCAPPHTRLTVASHPVEAANPLLSARAAKLIKLQPSYR